MGFHRGPNIITDGLVLALDAGSERSYPGSGTTWNDLSGNGFNFDTSTAPAFITGVNNQKCFDFTSASHQYFQSTTNSPFSGNSFQITVECVLSQDVLGSYLSVLGQNPNSGSGGMSFLSYNGFFGTDHWAPNGRKLSSVASQNQVYMITWVIDSWSTHHTTTKIYLNAVNQPTTMHGTLTTPTLLTNVFTIGNWEISRTDMDFDGQIYTMKVYNKALTAAEITQNFNAQKNRFNL
jgi:hypothetical protein